ncbi:MAG: NlpC/P60 family protein [Gemmatimonadota bacterium]
MRPAPPRPVAAVCLWLALYSCAGLHPAPQYAPPEEGGGDAVARDLGVRRAAFRAGDRGRLMDAVEGYLGVPYRWGGTTREGKDCSALTRAVYRQAYGLELPRTSGQMYRLGRPVSRRQDLLPGDLVFFRLGESGPGVSHVGVYMGRGRFAHASVSRGGVIDPLGDPYFAARYAGARRLLP